MKKSCSGRASNSIGPNILGRGDDGDDAQDDGDDAQDEDDGGKRGFVGKEGFVGTQMSPDSNANSKEGGGITILTFGVANFFNFFVE